ncbi:MAG: hypothetical protein IMW89_04125 [Ktedonobacteraceae bacterium]|nr:hypothetical protein [Ktedonobacteraceae bacterium]
MNIPNITKPTLQRRQLLAGAFALGVSALIGFTAAGTLSTQHAMANNRYDDPENKEEANSSDNYGSDDYGKGKHKKGKGKQKKEQKPTPQPTARPTEKPVPQPTEKPAPAPKAVPAVPALPPTGSDPGSVQLP